MNIHRLKCNVEGESMGRLAHVSKVKIHKEPGKDKVKRAEIEGFPGVTSGMGRKRRHRRILQGPARRALAFDARLRSRSRRRLPHRHSSRSAGRPRHLHQPRKTGSRRRRPHGRNRPQTPAHPRSREIPDQNNERPARSHRARPRTPRRTLPRLRESVKRGITVEWLSEIVEE